MNTISNALKEIIQGNPLFEFGFQNQLFNQAQFARYLNPLIKARLQKEVSDNAIMMNLSRLRESLINSNLDVTQYRIEKLTLFSKLAKFTYARTDKTLRDLAVLHSYVSVKKGFFHMCDCVNEITVFINSSDQPKLKK